MDSDLFLDGDARESDGRLEVCVAILGAFHLILDSVQGHTWMLFSVVKV